jgi:drug/metabolite transporter (DMT)-like permease
MGSRADDRRMKSPTATLAAPAASSAERGVLLMVAGGLLLGTLGVFVEEAGQHPLTAVCFRCAFGGLALLAWGAATGRLPELRLAPRARAAALACGLLMVSNWALFFAAIERTSIGVATVVFHVQPLWVMGFGAWWLRERIGARRWAAVALALLGLALASGLAGPARQTPGDVDSARYLAGLAMCLGGSLSYAAVTLIAKLARGASSFALATWQCAVGVVLTAWWPLSQGWPAQPAAWGWLAGLGVIHTGLAYVLLYAGMARLPTGRIALLQFVYPFAAVGVDWLVYGRSLTAWQSAGMLLMGAALWNARSRAA